jgi:hypothetical protein
MVFSVQEERPLTPSFPGRSVIFSITRSVYVPPERGVLVKDVLVKRKKRHLPLCPYFESTFAVLS